MAKCKGQALAFLLMVCGLVVQGQDAAEHKQQHPTVTARMGEGISFTAPDSSLKLTFNIRLQTLFTAEQPLTSGAPMEKQLAVRRFRVRLEGFAFTPKLEYKFQLGLSNQDNASVPGQSGSLIVRDAVLRYNFSKQTQLWLGQTKLPGNRERVISSQNLQFGDRSLVNALYTLDRDIGVQLHHQFQLGQVVVRDKYAVSLGQGRNVTARDTGGLSYTARLEVLPLGAFTNDGDYFDADLEREQTPKLSLAAGFNYNDDAARKAGTTGVFLKDARDLSTFFADMMFKYRGWSLSSEYINKKADRNPVLDDTSDFFMAGWGWNIQSGYLFRNNVEIAARYTIVEPTDEINKVGLLRRVREMTLGVSKYFLHHDLKVQGDISHIKDDIKSDPSLRVRLKFEIAL
jgi:phosphate-selective porin OprO/OprP